MGPTVEHFVIAHASYIDFTRARNFMTLGSPEGRAISQSTRLRSLDILLVGPSHMHEVNLKFCKFLTDSTIHRLPPGIRTIRFVLQTVLSVEAPADEGTVGQPGDETTLWSCVNDASAQLFSGTTVEFVMGYQWATRAEVADMRGFLRAHLAPMVGRGQLVLFPDILCISPYTQIVLLEMACRPEACSSLPP
ncbi:hypothetical protein K466DRAFT_591616 [Polyporus arcularius HHB13444]|uniref:Uncharacterized protein n=1 Tax=Polyporus arcularius HHB13444 TaxID=1314778 RepID=A0A5C3NU25_9APHY|nr:hypothetical protein K466DRAFT_591616 [Polyporus arcularius HHB13444]